MIVTVLGSGSSGGVPLIGNYWGDCNPKNKKNNRTRVSISIELKNKKNILIDTSPDLRVQAINNKLKSIDAVLWTHAHADHANGIDDLRQFLWTKKEELPVYGSKDTINSLKKRFDYVFSKTNNYFQPPLNINVIKEGEFKLLGTTASAFNQIHGSEITYGYRINNFAYSTDVKEFPKSSEEYLQNLDLWIVDCVRYEPHYSHSHLEQTLAWIKRYKPKKAILTHLGAWLDYDKLKKLCPSNVFPGYDGLKIKLT
ncbi:MAG: MBL fold metallo-hydrolase [Rickettsiales bacterium TMED254]|nr:MBL fold metallo-hydrolase [Rickettsiales bacterium]RPF77766.1 MAG: MBL fold metallo-hydrolase [Rickettsiales bacterium TMED254]